MIETSSASRFADQGANDAGADAGLKAGAGFAFAFRLREAMRRKAAFAVSKA
jgi:hypothetical protein